MIKNTIRGKEDWHHPYCVKLYKGKFKLHGWECVCGFLYSYDKWLNNNTDKSYIHLRDAYRNVNNANNT